MFWKKEREQQEYRPEIYHVCGITSDDQRVFFAWNAGKITFTTNPLYASYFNRDWANRIVNTYKFDFARFRSVWSGNIYIMEPARPRGTSEGVVEND